MLSKKIFKSWRIDICSLAVPYADSVLRQNIKLLNVAVNRAIFEVKYLLNKRLFNLDR